MSRTKVFEKWVMMSCLSVRSVCVVLNESWTWIRKETGNVTQIASLSMWYPSAFIMNQAETVLVVRGWIRNWDPIYIRGVGPSHVDRNGFHPPTPQVLFPTVDPKRRTTKIPRVPLPLGTRVRVSRCCQELHQWSFKFWNDTDREHRSYSFLT